MITISLRSCNFNKHALAVNNEALTFTLINHNK